MKPDLLVQEYEAGRGFTRDLPDADVLMLLSRLVTEHFVRHDGADAPVAAIGNAVELGMTIGLDVSRAQREMPAGDIPGSSN